MFTAQPCLYLTRPDRRPFEGELAAITLWPEVEKVFGHGYEVSYQLLLHRLSLNLVVSSQSPSRPLTHARY